MDNKKDYNFKPLPEKVFLEGEPYKGEAAFVNGYNGYTKTENDAVLCALIDNSCWTDGKANTLLDEDGNKIHCENRRSQHVNF